MNLEAYPLEFVKPLRFCIEMLGKCYIRFDDNDGFYLKKFSNCFLMLLCVVLHFASLTKFVVEVFSEKTDVADLAFSIPIYVAYIQAFFKAMVLISNKHAIRILIHELGQSWRVENLSEVQTLKKQALLKKLEICQKTFYYITMIGSYVYFLAPLIELFLRFVWHQEMKPRFPYPCSYPFDPFRNWLIYAGTYVFQSFNALYFIYAYLGAEFFMVALCSHISTEFYLLQEDMRNVKPTINRNIRQYEDDIGMTIEDFVKEHQRIIKLSKKLDDIFNTMNFFNFLFATIVLCFFAIGAKVAHGSVMSQAVNYLCVVGTLAPLFILCHYGEMLRVESAGIADAAYNNLWYTRNVQYQKSIALIILRSQRPCCLTLLKCYPITLATFTKVLSTTWSYFSVITSIYEEKD